MVVFSVLRRALPLVVAVLATVFERSFGSSFLKPGQVSVDEVERSLLAELEETFRPTAAKGRLKELEAALEPMFTALPKEMDGSLGHAAVRYALHRFFLQSHGWFIRGLEPEGFASRGKVLNGDLADHVPAYLQNIVEQKLGKTTVSFQVLAVLAATLEDLIHKEANGRLQTVYESLGLDSGSLLAKVDADEALEMYLMVYLKGGNLSTSSPREARIGLSAFKDRYPEWRAVADWMYEVRREVSYLQALDGDAVSGPDIGLSLAKANKITEEVGQRFGSFNDGECKSLKSVLLSMEGDKAGRVRLSDFYNSSKFTHWSVTESIGYLRVLGAVDESVPGSPYVLVPNYVTSRPNCLNASHFYDVCCRNECEDLMGTIERKFAAPVADPDELAKLVATLATETQPAPRELPQGLLDRLANVARSNGGQVPLHGRLFSQWMHHAFPRECPFPYIDAASPQTPMEWMSDADNVASEEDMLTHTNADASANAEKGAELPWIHEERLLVHSEVLAKQPKITQTSSPPLRGWLRVSFALLMPVCAGLGWLFFLKPSRKKGRFE